MKTAYHKLTKTFKRLHSFSHLGAIVGWDEAVNMPEKSGEARAEALSELSFFKSETMKDPALLELLNQAEEQNDLSEWQKDNLSNMRRRWENSNLLPTDLVREMSKKNMLCNQAWRRYRSENNWKDFAPLLEEVVNLSKREAEIRSSASGKSKYNSLLDLYEPGLTTDAVDKLFSPLEKELPTILAQVLEKQKASPFISPNGPFSINSQRELGLEIMQSLGFDFSRGRVDVSHHPFCGGVPEDVRITTRYNEANFTESLMGIVHETGHASYEQNLPKEWLDQPVGTAQGMAVHEGQSLFFEMQMGRGPEFINFALPLMKKHFSAAANDPAWTHENMARLYQEVKPGLIRVDADEVTYPFHVMLRYDIEKDLIENKLQVKDLPEVWNEKMQQYLDLSTEGNYADGVMQDVHWPSGSLGYFPTYTLGAMVAAQLFTKLESEHGGVREQISKGDFSLVSSWLNEKVWCHGSRFNVNQLLTNATGEELDSKYFLAHLKKRYL